MLAPIVLFTYNRPWHVRETVVALRRNTLAGESDLIVFSDGPRVTGDLAKDARTQAYVAEVRQYLRTIDGFASTTIIERDRNIGLGQNLIDGITRMVNERGRLIVLEDDLVTSPWFLQFMNDGLEQYQDDDRVAAIHGSSYFGGRGLPETFFIKGTDCLGWATWQRAWRRFEPDGRKLLEQLRARGLEREFDWDGAYDYIGLLEAQIAGTVSSWAVRWYASAFLEDCYSLFPNRSLVRHIGNDGSGTHYQARDDRDPLNVALTERPIRVERIPVEPDPRVNREYQRFLRSGQSGLNRFRRTVVRIIRKLVRKATPT